MRELKFMAKLHIREIRILSETVKEGDLFNKGLMPDVSGSIYNYLRTGKEWEEYEEYKDEFRYEWLNPNIVKELKKSIQEGNGINMNSTVVCNGVAVTYEFETTRPDNLDDVARLYFEYRQEEGTFVDTVLFDILDSELEELRHLSPFSRELMSAKIYRYIVEAFGYVPVSES